MKSNKGFTLIELLAVIVILAIIALIATPTILGVIEKARKGSAESSALGYIDAVEKQIAIDMLETEETKRVFKDIVAGTATAITVDNTLNTNSNFSVKGQKPTSGTLNYDKTKGIITAGSLTITLNGKAYCVTYYGETPEDDSTISPGTAVAADDACPASS